MAKLVRVSDESGIEGLRQRLSGMVIQLPDDDELLAFSAGAWEAEKYTRCEAAGSLGHGERA